MTEQKQYINVAEMFKGVEPSFKEILLAPDVRGDLQYALEQINPDTVCPAVEDILNFARFVPLNKICVGIIGQDPYTNRTDAHGLCFSSRAAKVPPSLVSVFECLKHNGFIPADANPLPNLTSWAEAGVLLINATLTAEVGVKKAGLHKPFWSGYMRKIFARLGKLDQPIVWLLWGNHAKDFAKELGHNKKALILTEVHPSPTSQNGLSEERRFKYCRHFNQANEYLRLNGLPEIDWNPAKKVSDAHVVYTRGRISGDNSDAAQKHTSLLEEHMKNHIVYTDGSAINNGSKVLTGDAAARAGYAAYFIAGPIKGTKLTGRIGPGNNEFLGGEVMLPSNIRAEGIAIVRSLQYVLDTEVKVAVEVVTDSEHWVNMMGIYMPKWVKTSPESPFAAHKNPDICKDLWDLCASLKARGTPVTFRHIYGHGGNNGKMTAKKSGLLKSTMLTDIIYNGLVDAWAGQARNALHFYDDVAQHPL